MENRAHAASGIVQNVNALKQPALKRHNWQSSPMVLQFSAWYTIWLHHHPLEQFAASKSSSIYHSKQTLQYISTSYLMIATNIKYKFIETTVPV
jgi:hypothetical protein